MKKNGTNNYELNIYSLGDNIKILVFICIFATQFPSTVSGNILTATTVISALYVIHSL